MDTLCQKGSRIYEKTLTASTAVTGSSSNGSSFASVLKQAHNGLLGDGVKVTSVYEDNSTDMNMVYDPSHPDADENGYVTYPNVNVVQEMTDLLMLPDLMRQTFLHLMQAKQWQIKDLQLENSKQ